jgi:ubiquinone/menaquinone biosynthesis C-methylase UbiE
MSIEQPGKFEIFMHEFIWLVLLKGYYRNYVQSFGLKGNEHVLDFGCGPGSTARFIAQAVERGGGRLVCFDLSPDWISRARKHLSGYQKVSYHTGDIREWREKDKTFDIVTMHYIFHEIPQAEREEVLDALIRKMKPGAKMFIREPVKESHGIPPDEMRSLFSAHGLKEIRLFMDKKPLIGEMVTGVYEYSP